MHLVGLYEKVRELGPHGWGRPFMYKRSVSQQPPKLTPYKGEYWDTTRAGLWVPRIGGGVNSGNNGYTQVLGNLQWPSMVSINAVQQHTLALDSNYVAGTGGDAISTRFSLRGAETLDKVYFYIVSYGGTAANVNDIVIEVRPGDGTTNKPATGTLTDSEVIDPASATGWVSKQFATPPTISADAETHIIIGDPDGTTDFATVLRGSRGAFGEAAITIMGRWRAYQTTDGFLNSTDGQNYSCIVATFASGLVLGNPFTTQTNATSDQLKKGLLINGLTEAIKIIGATTGTGASGYTSIELWTGANGPGGSPTATGTCPIFFASNISKYGFLFATAQTLAKATQYRVVFEYNTNTNSPVKYEIGSGADATLKSLMFGGGSWMWTNEAAGPVWVDDDDAWPNMTLLVEDQVAVPDPPIYQLGI